MSADTAIARHLIVVSYDAFSEDNWSYASSLPNLSKLIQAGAHSTKLRSVFPTLTYVVHTTIATGVYPNKHGIFNNNPLQPFVPEEEQTWFWYRDAIQAPTIYDAAHEQGLRTAGLLWPVSGRSSIHYNLPEIRAIKNENQALKILRSGSALYCLGMELKFGRTRQGIAQPNLDDFTTQCAVDTIKHKKPNLLMLHLIDLDDTKHAYGTDSEQVRDAITRMDRRIGDLMRAVQEAGIADDTVFLVIGDHGQFNVKRRVHLNNLLRDKGLIFEENGLLRWRAYFQCGGGAAYLHIQPGDEEAEQLALAALADYMQDDASGIERLYTGDELDAAYASRVARVMLDAKLDYSFDESLSEHLIEDLEAQGIKHATHGYSPDREGYRCNLVISGKGVKSGYSLGDVQMVDIAPTMARVLGIRFEKCDGRTLDDIFKNHIQESHS